MGKLLSTEGSGFVFRELSIKSVTHQTRDVVVVVARSCIVSRRHEASRGISGASRVTCDAA